MTSQRAAAELLDRETGEIREVPGFGQLEAQTRGEVDVQIGTAKRFPRSVKRFLEEAEALATLNEDVAASCFYAVPRQGKTIEGPSARLAELCASSWGHMRIQSRIVDEDERFLTARGEAWDVQNNVAIGYEVRRRITDKQGRKFNDDMIGVTANAAASIALRNAVFKVIPSAFWRPIYEQCRKVAVGNAKTLANRRADLLAYFQKMGVEPARVFAVLGVTGVEDVTLEHLATLRGLATAIKEGDTSVDDAFRAVEAVPMPQRKRTNGIAAPAEPTPARKPPTRPTPVKNADPEIPAGADQILTVTRHGPDESGDPWWTITTLRGVAAYTWDAAMAAQLDGCRNRKTAVDLDVEDDGDGGKSVLAVAAFDVFGGAAAPRQPIRDREPGEDDDQ